MDKVAIAKQLIGLATKLVNEPVTLWVPGAVLDHDDECVKVRFDKDKVTIGGNVIDDEQHAMLKDYCMELQQVMSQIPEKP